MDTNDKKIKIFIIDDDSFLLDMYALKFSQSNFEVDTALGSEIALEKLKSGLKCDVVLLDIIMPVMDGFELLKKIKEEKLIPGSTMIILSNKGEKSDILRGQDLGASGYIIKSNTTPSEVIQQVVGILKTNKKI